MRSMTGEKRAPATGGCILEAVWKDMFTIMIPWLRHWGCEMCRHPVLRTTSS